jgi:hypothetical protein
MKQERERGQKKNLPEILKAKETKVLESLSSFNFCLV